MKLSKNFSLRELTKSDDAQRQRIRNVPNKLQIENLTRVATKILQPVRDKFGITVCSSGFRCQKLNAFIGSSKSSQHCKGQAADFECWGTSNFVVAKWIMDNLEFDKLILEYHNPKIPSSGWLHCSIKRYGNRNRALTVNKDPKQKGRPKYNLLANYIKERGL